MFTLTSYEPTICCFGTSFKTVAAARNYAVKLQKKGLCQRFSVGCYHKKKHVGVYDSHREYKDGRIRTS